MPRPNLSGQPRRCSCHLIPFRKLRPYRLCPRCKVMDGLVRVMLRQLGRLETALHRERMEIARHGSKSTALRMVEYRLRYPALTEADLFEADRAMVAAFPQSRYADAQYEPHWR